MADTAEEWWRELAKNPAARDYCADWCEERGDVRGAMLRALIEVEKNQHDSHYIWKRNAIIDALEPHGLTQSTLLKVFNDKLKEVTGDDSTTFGINYYEQSPTLSLFITVDTLIAH